MAFLLVLALCAGIGQSLEVPVFPLRQPRFPTEVLRLNLFEARYLALARAVLSSSPKVFAGVYCGDVASVLPRGTSLPTPLVAPSAVGVLFEVNRSEEEIAGEKKIRLEASAFARCRVRSVTSSPAKGGREPYIIVDTEPLVDDESTEAMQEELATARAIDDVEALLEKLWGPYGGRDEDVSDDSRRYDAVRRFAPALDEECVIAELERQCLLSSECVGYAPSRTELFSFALLATLSLSPRDRQRALECTDTLGRLRHVSHELTTGRNWLAARAALADLLC